MANELDDALKLADRLLDEKPFPVDPLKLFVFNEQKGMCWLCDMLMVIDSAGPPNAATWDHILPRSHGGTWHRDNLKLAHKVCNERRGNGPPLKLPPWNQPYAHQTERLARLPASAPIADKNARPFTGAWLRGHGYMK